MSRGSAGGPEAGDPARRPASRRRARSDTGRNQTHWDAIADEYQRDHGPQLNTKPLAWGPWSIPEDELRVLGDVRDRDVLELGCGAAQWSIFLAERGVRPVGADISARQLRHARRLCRHHGASFPLVQADAERLPFANASFDVVFCDHGAMSFADPYRSVPEAARVLRPGGLLAFNMYSPLVFVCIDPVTDEVTNVLRGDYHGMHRFEFSGWGPKPHVEYQLPYGEWIRLFRRSGLVVEDLVELRPPADATTTYDVGTGFLEWQRRWPAEHVWRCRREG